MNSTPITVKIGTTLKAAITKMRDERVDSLLITDSDNVLRGFLDIESINNNYKKASTVEEVMETDIYSVSQDSLLRDAIHKILRRGAQYVPIVDEGHRLVGIVTRATLATLVYDTIWGDGTEFEEIVAHAE